MKKTQKNTGNQSISLPKKRELTPTETRSSKHRNYRYKKKQGLAPIIQTNKSSGRRSQMTNRELKSLGYPNIENSVLNKTSISNLITTSSQNFNTKKPVSELISSNSVDLVQNNKRSTEFRCNSISPRKGTPKSPGRLLGSLNIESVSIREASRIKEWASKGKPEIEKMWRKMINNSNGIEPSNLVFASYSIFIGKGNNAGLIKKLFLNRPWWQIVDNKETANFVWTQWKDKQVLKDFKCSASKVQINEDFELSPLICSYKAQIATRVYRSVDIENLGLQFIRNSSSYITLRTEKISPDQQRIHNRLENNDCLSNKKELLQTMKNFYLAIGADVFETIPLTFNVKDENDEEFKEFLKYYKKFEKKKNSNHSFHNIWIVKPGEFTNRGAGITVCKGLAEIKQLLIPADSRSYVIQKYIEKPLLIYKRKFDIRCYALITSINGIFQGYFYLDGYLRTTSTEFSIKDIQNPFIHLTNDAIQKQSTDYGKFENGNKLSYRDFQRYLDVYHSDKKINFSANILPVIRKIVKDTILASFLRLDPLKRMHSMEIFGYDFMIDQKFRPWLIEVNTNPCLELSSPYLSSLIPAMVENALKISIDSIFPAPIGEYVDNCSANRFELIFHQEVDGKKFLEKIGENKKLIDCC